MLQLKSQQNQIEKIIIKKVSKMIGYKINIWVSTNSNQKKAGMAIPILEQTLHQKKKRF